MTTISVELLMLLPKDIIRILILLLSTEYFSSAYLYPGLTLLPEFPFCLGRPS